MYGKIERIHFVGIGGIGMSGIAEVLLNLGYRVSGSDLKESDITQRLAGLGGEITIGHRPANVADADVVVISSAVRDDNPEVKEARRRMIPVIPRAEMLAELMRMKYGIAVAGTHGKTTTTSMIATLLTHGGLDPTIVIGGKLNTLGSNAKLGRGDFLVAEADESDGSFLALSPSIAVVTTIDEDHLDHYQGGIEEIKDAFVQFINKIPFYGLAVLCLEDPNVAEIIPRVRKRFVTYGLSSQCDIRATHIRLEGGTTSFLLHYRGYRMGEISFRMPGAHNVLNALASIAVACELDIPFDAIREGFALFGGVGRRFQTKGEVNGITVVDDYGHHPAEIRATLAAARSGWPERRIVTAFQPHRYTRTRDLFDQFLTCFHHADLLVITDIYPAGERPIEGVDARRLAEEIGRHGQKNVFYVPTLEELPPFLAEHAHPGDMVITMGAGSITRAGDELVTLLEQRNR